LDQKDGKWQEAGENGILRKFRTCTLAKYNRMVLSKRRRWEGHVTRMVRRLVHINYWRECPKGMDHKDNQDVLDG
jgi:hypothetical protein